MKALLVALTAIAVVACGSDDASDGENEEIPADQVALLADLDGSRLLVTSIDGESVLEDTTLTFSVAADGSIQGTTGCNPFTGQVTAEVDSVSVGQLAVGASLCPSEDAQDQERRFTEAVTQTTALRVDAETVTLVDGDGTVRVEAMISTGGIVGAWEVTGYNNGRDAVVSPIVDTTITATFDEDGSIAGSGGCNEYGATYSIEGDTISIEPGEITEEGCTEPSGVMEQEQEYIGALASSATWSITGDVLTLRNGIDEISVTMSLAP